MLPVGNDREHTHTRTVMRTRTHTHTHTCTHMRASRRLVTGSWMKRAGDDTRKLTPEPEYLLSLLIV
jgi:hypothetical protein